MAVEAAWSISQISGAFPQIAKLNRFPGIRSFSTEQIVSLFDTVDV